MPNRRVRPIGRRRGLARERPLQVWAVAALGSAGSVLSGCSGPQSMMEQAGPEAANILKLWWVLFSVGVLVVAAVTAVLLGGCFRRRPASGEEAPQSRLGRAMVIGGAVTVLLLLVILVASYTYSQPLENERDEDVLTIEVLAKRWWWEVRYLDEAGELWFTTANEIHMPAGVPVRFRLLSDNVIHSFWVPQLGGKIDMIRGRVNYLWLEADEPGIYRGQCAEFCGVQHAKMAFLVFARPIEEFQQWVAEQAEPADEPVDAQAWRGREVFTQSLCADCHTIRGVSLAGEGAMVGPDLTHFASRRSLAAETAPNTRGHLAGWLADPQSMKPGNLMPWVPLPAEEFNALLHYLEGLE